MKRAGNDARRPELALGSALALLAGLAACSSDSAEPGSAASSLVGLYAPGSALGAAAPRTAESEAETMTSDAELNSYFAVPPGDRCVGIDPAPMAKGGTLSVMFSSVLLNQRWSPDNVGAVWVEDASERYVKTLALWAAVRRKSLYKYGKRACQRPEVDVVTAATLPTPSPHQVMWNAKDLNGNMVPDGTYTLFIEVTETELDVGSTGKYEFQKGPMPAMLQPLDAPPVKGLTITYTPMP